MDISLRYSDFDVNGHVNNTIYLGFLETLYHKTINSNERPIKNIQIGNWNIRYRKASYQTPAGDYVTGKLSSKVSNSHFGSTLTAFILYQYYHGHVTQPLIAEQLRDYGVGISSGQINRIISESNGRYHYEKDMLLSTGLELSNYVNVDDTGARHMGNFSPKHGVFGRALSMKSIL
ncbi:MAG: thioesterase [Desulfobacula sp.]|jgi:hypothetical protein|nr:thioesterase [Desulfobacula sp.]